MSLNEESFDEKLKTEQELLETAPLDDTPGSESAPQQEPSRTPARMPESQGMIIAALGIGIASVAGMMCVFPALLLAPIGITVALLSRGANSKMDPRAKIGMILSVAGMVLSVFMIFSSFYMVKHDPVMKQQYKEIMEQTYGEEYIEQMPEFFKELME